MSLYYAFAYYFECDVLYVTVKSCKEKKNRF